MRRFNNSLGISSPLCAEEKSQDKRHYHAPDEHMPNSSCSVMWPRVSEGEKPILRRKSRSRSRRLAEAEDCPLIFWKRWNREETVSIRKRRQKEARLIAQQDRSNRKGTRDL